MPKRAAWRSTRCEARIVKAANVKSSNRQTTLRRFQVKIASRALATVIGIAIPAVAFGQTTPAPAAAARASDNMEGLAAVYSDKLAGRKTASGEVFSQSKLTAAHQSLPFGTMVKVTSTKN